ncbi:DNA polymerase III subunit beta [Glutamicibacter sp.]|uniref:DNA polymerase III subunit beta n=1 Tax=Glutamicibacter sp. TaxID=1931995 RepID=UPI0028BE8BF1|nr:DNA polymerase III subunit beta [Glutamicibacter sp.]
MTVTLEALGVRSQTDEAALIVPARELLAMLKKVRVPGRVPSPLMALTALSFQESGWLAVETFDYQTGLCAARGKADDSPVQQRLILGEFVIPVLTEITRGAAKDLEVTLRWTWDSAENLSRLSLESDGFEISVPSARASQGHDEFFDVFLKGTNPHPGAQQRHLTIDVQAFRDTLDQVMHSASKDDTLPILTSIALDFSTDKVTAYATDRYRLARSWFPTRCDFDGQFLIKLTEWKRIRTLLDKPGDMKLTLSGPVGAKSLDHLMMRSESFSASTLCVSGEYPKIKPLFRPEGEQHLIFSATEMMRAARIVQTVLERNIPLILTSTEDRSSLQITGSGEDGSARSPLIRAEGDLELRTGFNPTFYREALGAIRGDKIRISVHAPGKGVRLTSGVEPLDQVTLEQVVMPVRLPKPEPKL